jgi:hypothetical protein
MQHSVKTSSSDRAITLGLNAISHQQFIDGSFTIVASDGSTDTPFSVQLQLHAYLLDLLNTLATEQSAAIAYKLTTHLVRSLQSQDTDKLFSTIDTHVLFHALASIYEYNPQLVSQQLIAQAVHFLVAHEVQPGGPYRNALDAPGELPELATNITISRFIHHLGGPFEQLNSYIARNYKAHTKSRYYSDAWPLALQLEHTKLPRTSDLPIVSTLFSESSYLPAESRIGEQDPEGSWPVDFFYYHSSLSAVRYGSQALSTALVLSRLLQNRRSSSNGAVPSKSYAHAAKTVIRLAEKYTDQLDPLIANSIKQTIIRVTSADRHNEITLLAIRLSEHLATNRVAAVPALHTLGMANVYNWVAYTIYDDILDEDSNTLPLPAANVSARMAVDLFCQAVPGEPFRTLAHDTFTSVDTANAWELTYARSSHTTSVVHIPQKLPDYGDLAILSDRSLSHSLPALGALMVSGIDKQSTSFRRMQRVLRQYLIIRQLSDDLHDWQADLRNGQLSYVVTQLLQSAHVSPGTHRTSTLLRRLERTFWRQVLPAIGQDIIARAEQAEQLLRSCSGVQPGNFVEQLITGIDCMIQETLTLHDQTNAFLHAYKNIPSIRTKY